MRRVWRSAAGAWRPASRRAMHICIVGSGPSAFYTAKYFLRDRPDGRVDMVERLPTPFGLVVILEILREGVLAVAPDHQDTKSVTNEFQSILDDERCRFFGNVELDRDVTAEGLLKAYDSVVLACGAGSDVSMNIPGEHLQNCVSARAFVNWYNGHPDHVGDKYNLDVTDAVIIGQGNVAIDVARVLCSRGESLQHTDITEQAVEALQKSRIENVSVVGRRGPAQSSFTNKELRELITKRSFPTIIRPEDLDKDLMTEATRQELTTRAVHRKMEILWKAQKEGEQQARPIVEGQPVLRLRFYLNPVRILPSDSHPESVGAIEFERTRLEGAPGQQRSVPTGEFETIKAGLVVRSIGYRSISFNGIPFDDVKGIVPNVGGRAIRSDGSTFPCLYVTGWIKRGATGIIGSNIMDAAETVQAVLADAHVQTSGQDRDALWQSVADSGLSVVTKSGWKTIDADEVERGHSRGKPREKLTRLDDLLEKGRSDRSTSS
ncbi:hypothetical protein PBRA_001325 [Plasmodiophora brassicae]|uniref:NADPH:adrenodoxin oxidoreductase, mitochondrial n=1 Tax=Plasmodiophora brassicae TaxID=37360 RepID=A0A0G4IWA3_PLABS|nr:hypothetical protein PBRA_001325 [Plasmodiophora brassicae]